MPECCVRGAPINVAARGFAGQLISGGSHGSPDLNAEFLLNCRYSPSHAPRHPQLSLHGLPIGSSKVTLCGFSYFLDRFESTNRIPIVASSRLFFSIAARFASIFSTAACSAIAPSEANELAKCIPIVATCGLGRPPFFTVLNPYIYIYPHCPRDR